MTEASLTLDQPVTAVTPIDVDLRDIGILKGNLRALISGIRDVGHRPDGLKKAPTFNQAQLVDLLGWTKPMFARRFAAARELGLPIGKPAPSRSATAESLDAQVDERPDNGRGRREFTLEDIQAWARYAGLPLQRPVGTPGAVACVGNFKGGVAKTTTTMCLAQGLSLLGYRVLTIDLDPQGSLTSLFGILPTEVSIDQTLLPLFSGQRDTIRESIRSTYWSNVHLVAANRTLFESELHLPNRQLRDSHFRYWETLNRALDDGTREDYDYILIDTPPSLSYMTMNAFWAADAILMPLPPDGLDLVSSSQFWDMFHEHAAPFDDASNRKVYSWLGVLLSKTSEKDTSKTVMTWMKAGYGRHLLETKVPTKEVTRVASTTMKTVYDLTRNDVSPSTFRNSRDAYNALVKEVDGLTRQSLWRHVKEARL